MRRYLRLTFAIIASAGLASCAGQSEQRVQFVKAYPGLQIIMVSQKDETPPSRK